jgi:glycosyltransferase involved in cell wall biosynthesis
MKAANGPLVSVLTPVYNGEKYLAECIESVLAQDYPNWQYVILDNHSTDRTSEIAHAYAAKDERIRVTQPDRFVDVWENHHIAFGCVPADASYVKIVHADDWLFPRCLAEMVALAEAHPRVGMVSAYRLDDTRVSLAGLPYQANVFSGREITRWHLLTGRFVFGNPSALLLRAEVVRSRVPYYDRTRFPHHADTASCLDVLQEWDLGFVHQVLTYTRRHPGSLSTAAARRNTYIAENLNMLKVYGPVCLEPGELQARVQRRLKGYYRFLARSLFSNPGGDFWALHKDALDEAGHPFRYAELLKAGFMEALEISPGAVLRKARDLGQRILRRSPGPERPRPVLLLGPHGMGKPENVSP